MGWNKYGFTSFLYPYVIWDLAKLLFYAFAIAEPCFSETKWHVPKPMPHFIK